MKRIIFLFLVLTLFITAFRAATEALFVVPAGWPLPHYDFSTNPLTPEKIELGRALFYDPILSRDSTISCAGCHSPYTTFAHVDHALSHGIDNKIGTRNAPALVNLAWQRSFMWDGAINHLDMQALAPISNPDEMDEDLQHVVDKLQRTKLYPSLFFQAFGDSLITGERQLKAISQFMVTIISNNAKYDSVMRGQSAFTEQEKNGYALFQKNCSSCHTEPLFTNGEFENNGLQTDTTLNDFGRMKITQNPDDSMKFKVPTLRNAEFSYPYMHDGRFKRLSDVINHYTSGIRPGKTLSPLLKESIRLTPNEKVDLIAFLLTLTDNNFLFNTDYSYPKNIFSPLTEAYNSNNNK
jgi:cytochrome c peroxidase